MAVDIETDVLIIGAGIQGAGCAQAAAANGYRVLLIEQYSEPAQGTSQRSSKLVHGGLRYLETAQFHLVFESLQERKRLLNNAPKLVKLAPFYIPVYHNTTRRPWKIWAGLMLYSLFSRRAFRRIPRQEWQTLDHLKTQNLDAVFCYYDAQTDDAKLTRAVLDSAASLDAEIRYNTSFVSARTQPDHVQVTLNTQGKTVNINTATVINAAGPWVNQVAEKFLPDMQRPNVDLVQGAHIEVAGQVTRGMYYLEAPQDQRAVFIMPWKGRMLIGTTESLYQGDPAKVQPLASEIEYLLAVYNHYFEKTLSNDDVISSFAGLRVLPVSSDTAFSRPRDTVLITDKQEKPRVVSLYGGKLTVHRATAANVMKVLQHSLPRCKSIADTRTLRLPN
ncbi:MAG: FAD-dependent oxidoreductase [Gammaproteobacteria bacterium]